MQWTDALDAFLDGYEPAKNLMVSTHQFSTSELIQSLISHTGYPVETQEITEALEQKGYLYKRTGEKDIEWLFKKV